MLNKMEDFKYRSIWTAREDWLLMNWAGVDTLARF